MKESSKLNSAVLVDLREAVGEAHVHTTLEKRMVYSFDSTFQNYLPDVIVKPYTVEQASAVVRIAAKYQIPLTVRGAGTCLSGGPVAVEGGILMEMTAFKRILAIDADEYYAVVEPGVITNDLIAEAAKYGLFYPPDPSSSGMSTLGGNVAECAGGGRGVKYGVTRDYVLELQLILADGSIVTVGNKVDGLTGWLDLPMLFTGSEGTLAIITQMTVRLLPKPETIQTVLVQYDDLDAAANTVRAIISTGVVPTTIEIMDQMTIQAVENFLQIGLDTTKEAFVLLEVDGESWEVEQQLMQVIAICKQNGAVEVQVAKNKEDRAALWKARKSISGACGKINPTKIGEDIAVPPGNIPKMIQAVKTIAEKYQLNMVVFGHAGDGNLHPNILTDKNNTEEMERVNQAIAALFSSALALGGTLSGEHGIGFMKAPYLLQELGRDGYLAQKAIKDALDPDGILNPGKIFIEKELEKKVEEKNKKKRQEGINGGKSIFADK